MAKTPIEKAIEKQTKENQKAAREAKLRERAAACIQGASYINGFRVMDKEAEMLLSSVLKSYDGNDRNYINFNASDLPQYLRESFSLQCEKLQMYGMFSNAIVYMSGAMITLTESGKTYFIDKESAISVSKQSSKTGLSVAHKKYDVFISHANKDKIDYVDFLKENISQLGINVFYDKETLSWGDNWKQVILSGTADSEFAIIVISKNFFDREWTEKELEEFLNKQNERGQKIVLPLMYGISLDELKKHYPRLGDIQCISSDDYTYKDITILLAKELIKRYKS
ncbi:MAG: toll/interleukin-1 receptor domain-containing protein [Clostridia bacterium]|nr:toll/interleukin-1 receptor domain-containing protein [Clostridia bacterium]